MNKVFLEERQAFVLLQRYGLSMLPHTVLRAHNAAETIASTDFLPANVRIGNGNRRIIATRDELKEHASTVLNAHPDGEIFLTPCVEDSVCCVIRIWLSESSTHISMGMHGVGVYEERMVATDIRRFQIRRLLSHFDLSSGQRVFGQRLIHRAVRAFFSLDIVDLILDPVVIDASFSVGGVSMVVDGNALFRQREIAHDVVVPSSPFWHCSMPGSVGCLSNGRGLAMATADLVRVAGLQPASVIAVRGPLCRDQLVRGVRFLSEQPSVTMICINIFTGIVSCEHVAEWLCDACVPIRNICAIRLEGTQAAAGNIRLKKEEISSVTGLQELVPLLQRIGERIHADFT